MYIENSRMLKREQLFLVIHERNDPSVDNICPGCPLERFGCNHHVDIVKGKITARVNLDSFKVQFLKKSQEEVNCGNGDIKFNA